MTPPPRLFIEAANHRDPEVARFGFELDDPYVEDVWIATIGPTATLLLRRIPPLWRSSMPAEVDVADLSASLGLGGGVGGRNSTIWRTFDRLAGFGLATPVRDERVGVLARVPPLSERQLGRVGEWTRRTHDRLLERHLDDLGGSRTADPAVARPDRVGSPGAARLTARLDDLQLRSAGPDLPIGLTPG